MNQSNTSVDFWYQGSEQAHLTSNTSAQSVNWKVKYRLQVKLNLILTETEFIVE